ncbi:hypothetical protein A9Q84_15910 [Halobacteriovorax marinus]|uniref:Lipid/polyisoprenoid-binding YceI-like domain-containing protein n=1 Tax=Halobacteriovorax marinus TaxID=97084 RepID=A0A1Y5F7Z9_9BACT|nr:hypothetical protein A9Q84_15910 [Halobacteriovorax marinus]
MGISEVEGSFNKFDGAFDFDQKTKKLNNVELVIQTKSIDTDNQKRDAHIRKKDFFHVKKFPQITFKSTKTYYKLSSPVKLEGLMTLLGVTKPVTFKITYQGMRNDPWDTSKKAIFFKASALVNRKDFGLTWNKSMDTGGFVLGDKVTLNLKVEAFKEGVRPAFSRFYLPTKIIKKSVKAQILSQPIVEVVAPKKAVNVQKVVKQEEVENEAQSIFLNLVVGFVFFVLLIGTAIIIQIKLTKFLERKEFGYRATFIIPNLTVMIFIYIVAIQLAPYMGYGPHPWLK